MRRILLVPLIVCTGILSSILFWPRGATASDSAPLPSVTCPSTVTPARVGTIGLRDVIADKVQSISLSQFFSNHVVWAADSRSIYVVVAQPQSGINEQRTILRVDARTGTCTGLVRGYDPVPSPNGKWLAFITSLNGDDELWIASADGSNAHAIPETIGNLGVDFFKEIAWSHDSSRLAYVVLHKRGLYGKMRSEATPAPAPIVLTPRSQDQSTAVNAELWTYRPSDGSRSRLATFSYEPTYVRWDEKHGRILFATMRLGGRPDYVIGAYYLSNGQTATLLRPGGMQQTLMPLPSPDGKLVAFAYDPSNNFYDWKASIFVAAPNFTHIRRLTDGRTAPTADRSWAPDSAHLYIGLQIGAYKQIYLLGVNGRLKRIVNEPRSDEEIQVSPNGKSLLWLTEDAVGHTDVRVANLDGSSERVVYDLSPRYQAYSFRQPAEISWTGDDGVRLSGLLFTPRNFNAQKRYPMYVEFHGAGRETLTGEMSFDPLEWQMWLDRGFVVFVPDYAGWGSYGADVVMKRIREHRLYDADINDIATGVRAVEARGYVDTRNVFLFAESSGAAHTDLWITRPNPFRAVVSDEGWADWYNYMFSEVTPPDGHDLGLEGELQGTPWDTPQYFWERSGIYHLKGLRTPTLWIAGDPDFGAVGAGASGIRLMYAALAAQTGDAELVIYPKEGHGMYRIDDIRDALQRIIRWIDAHRVYN